MTKMGGIKLGSSKIPIISDIQLIILNLISAILGVGVTVYWLMPELMSDFCSEVS